MLRFLSWTVRIARATGGGPWVVASLSAALVISGAVLSAADPAAAKPAAAKPAAAETVRANAVVAVSFDEANGPASVKVTGSSEPFSATLVNGPMRVASPFWNQTGKSALRLDAAKRQFVRLSDIPYLDRPDAVTLSFFFLSLHDGNDAATHGIVGKRSAGPRGANYGINYVPASDTFQLYVNDGRGFRIATYSARRVIGARRLVHLTATLEVGDAPAPDMDNDRDDLLARLFVNGEQVPPKSVSGGAASGPDVWFTNLNLPGLLNDAPLTLGSSGTGMEYTSGVIDEFLLFPRALTPADAHRLFLEMAGPNGPALARRELEDRRRPALPTIESASQLGLEIGQTTRLMIRGNGLVGEPRVDLPIAGVKQSVVHGSSARRLLVDLTLPANVPPGIYPLSVVTSAGISNSIGIAVDGLPQLLVGDSSADRPSMLPGAFSGLLSGSAQGRVYFQGKAGARVVAEVESRRIGSSLEPVLELKSATGSTVAIEWGKTFLHGDARTVVRLPHDGTYYVELHDLAYQAPADSPYRLLLGDFRAVDAYFPPVVARGSSLEIEPLGTGIPAGMLIAANLKGDGAGLTKLLTVPAELHASGPLPPLRISDGIEILEVPQPADQLQTVDARFADKRHRSVAISGRLAKPGEVDRYLLAVAPGQSLSLSIDGQSLNSPVEGEIALLSHPDRKVLASAGETPGPASRGLQYQVPADVSAVELTVRDLLERGGPHFVYRVHVSPAGQPSFSLAFLESRINLTQNGRSMAQLRVDRANYAGPIDLHVEGSDRISISPARLPAEGGSRTVLVTFTAAANKPLANVQRLRIVGESVGVNPSIRRTALVESPSQAQLAGFPDQIPAAGRGECPAQIETPALAGSLLRGVDAEWPVTVKEMPGEEGRWLRLSLVSTEKPRPIDPKNANRRRRRRNVQTLIAAAADQSLPAAAGKGSLKVSVPLDVPEPAIDFVVKAEVVPHPYSDRVLATTFSEPFRMLVQDPVNATLESASLKLTAGAPTKIRGQLVRNANFKQPVTVALTGLPAGYASQAVTVAGDKTQFEIPVTAAAEPAARVVPNVALVVTLADGKIPINRPIEMKVAPPAKKK